AFDQGLVTEPGVEIYRLFVQVGWILAPIVCGLAVLLALGYARKARVWTIVLSVLTTLWAIGTAHALSSTTADESDRPGIGLYVVIAASVAALIVAIVTRKSTAPSSSPA